MANHGISTPRHPRRLLGALADALPIHAEEGGLREAISESTLVERLTTAAGDDRDVRCTVALMRCLYQSLGLLDDAELLQDRWAFVSFPASLMARSTLDTLASGTGFFEPGYWLQGGHRPLAIVEEQRELLHRLETQRLHAAGSAADARPIRTVHVAWGLIRLGDQYLLRAREDRDRPDRPRYVFPGGRLDPTDLPKSAHTPEALLDLFRLDSELAEESMPRTLARELREELNLVRCDFEAAPLQNLPPFRMLEGTRNNFSYTQYNIALFAVRLTAAGEIKVLDRVAAEPAEWAWFRPAELIAGATSDGKRAFIDALRAGIAKNIATFLERDVPSSSTMSYRLHEDRFAVDLPAGPDLPLVMGMTGRELPVSFAPNETEWQILMAMGWHARGLPMTLAPSSGARLGNGWLRLDDSALASATRSLASRLSECGIPLVEIDKTGHCRLSLPAANIYFAPKNFRYSWNTDDEKKSVLVTLERKEFEWVSLGHDSRLVVLAPKVARDLYATEVGKAVSGDFERAVRAHFERTRTLGLRKFIAAARGTFEIVVPPE